MHPLWVQHDDAIDWSQSKRERIERDLREGRYEQSDGES